MSRALENGKPLAPALFAYAQELPPGRRRRRLQRMAKQLEQGYDPSHELRPAKSTKIGFVYSASARRRATRVRSPAESSMSFSERTIFVRQFASALAYPLLLFAVSLAILLFITWWIVPTFQEIFADFGIVFPAATRLALRISETIRESHGLVVLIPTLVLAAMIGFVGSRSAIWTFGTGCSTIFLSSVPRFDFRIEPDSLDYLADLMERKSRSPMRCESAVRNTGHTALRREANRLATEMDLGNANLGDARCVPPEPSPTRWFTPCSFTQIPGPPP